MFDCRAIRCEWTDVGEVIDEVYSEISLLTCRSRIMEGQTYM